MMRSLILGMPMRTVFSFVLNLALSIKNQQQKERDEVLQSIKAMLAGGILARVLARKPFYFPSVNEGSIVIESVGRLSTFTFSRPFMTRRVRRNRSPIPSVCLPVYLPSRFLLDR